MDNQWAFFCEQALETCALAILRFAPLWDNKLNAPASFAPNLDFQWEQPPQQPRADALS